MSRPLLLSLILCASACASVRPARQPGPAARPASTDLPLGDPTRRQRHAPVVLDGITDTATGKVLTTADLAARLADVQVLLVGETHTSPTAHHVQERVIQALQLAGRRVIIGLEMLPSSTDDVLARWTAGTLDQDQLLRGSRWYEHWGFPFGLYEGVFQLARQRGSTMVGLNVPREIVATVRRKGIEGLAPADREHLPPRIDTADPEHRKFFRALFDPADSTHGAMSPELWEGIFRAQCTWDAAMAHKAVAALQAAGNAGNSIVVVLVGTGHVAYGLGIARQARLWFPGRIASLVPVPVMDQDGAAPRVRASYAEFLWGTPADPALAPYPTLGVALASKEGETLRVRTVEPGSSAARAGLLAGDELVSAAGEPLTDRAALALAMHHKAWGDAVVLEVKRNGKVQTITVPLRRTISH